MGKFIDLTGQKFGRLTVIKRAENAKCSNIQWFCQCECGKQTIVQGGTLRSGRTKSCGCLRIKHKYAIIDKISSTYEMWKNIIQRCTNSNNSRYKDYGGRGIRVCEAWRSFDHFFEDMGERPPNTSIDRIDNNKGYYKANCRWATRKEQARNTRTNKLITINGETKCLVEWCEIYQKSYHKIRQRIRTLKWNPEEALEIIPRKRKK